MARGGIYKITNTETGKSYIGQTNNFQRRKYEHFTEMSEGRHTNIGLQRDHNRGHKFTFTELIEEHDKPMRDHLEKEYIAKYNTFYNGYNRTIDGQHPKKRTTTYSNPKTYQNYVPPSNFQSSKNRSQRRHSSSGKTSTVKIIGYTILFLVIVFLAALTGLGGVLLSVIFILMCIFSCISSN